MKILIIEDDNDINNLVYNLLSSDYKVTQAFSGTEGRLLASQDYFQLIILDLMLPGLSGEELIKHFRTLTMIPILVLTAKADISVLEDVLALGADDYIAKPFSNRELIARVNRLLKSNTYFEIITAGDFILDLEKREISFQGEVLDLLVKEFELLALMIKNPLKVFTKEHLYTQVWKEEYYGDDNTIAVHMSRLRKKLAEKSDMELIKTIWGIGFKLNI